jgi:hypothetical protein
MRRLRVFLASIGNGQVEIFHRFTPCQAAAKAHGLEGRLSDIEPDTFSNHRQLCSLLILVMSPVYLVIWFVLFI